MIEALLKNFNRAASFETLGQSRIHMYVTKIGTMVNYQLHVYNLYHVLSEFLRITARNGKLPRTNSSRPSILLSANLLFCVTCDFCRSFINATE